MEDDPVNREVLRELLLEEGASVVLADDGLVAVELARAGSYDLVLMDMRMPVMDGFESTALIREMDLHVPVIALTASAFENERERALGNGFSGYLTKPFVPEDFYNYVLPFLGIRNQDAGSATN